MKSVQHRTRGMIDDMYSGIQVAAPLLLRLNSGMNTFKVLGSGILLFSAFARTPFGPKWLTSFKNYRRANRLFLTGLSLLPVLKFIGRSKTVRSFALGFAGTAATLVIVNHTKPGQGG